MEVRRGMENIDVENRPEEDLGLVKELKKEKASKVLFIIGTVFLAITFFCMWVFGDSVVKLLLASENQGGAALGVVVTAIYFGFPALVTGAVSVLLEILAFIFGKKQRILKLVFMILSIVILLLVVLFFILMAVA